MKISVQKIHHTLLSTRTIDVFSRDSNSLSLISILDPDFLLQRFSTEIESLARISETIWLFDSESP
jgi:hypothetical protein